jgi:dolichyl-phosphooligosaccharide-protein glycotransferase
VDKAAALSIMTTKYGLTQEQAQSIVQYTHPDNPTPHVFITSSDMIGKAGWWSYFGSWNFTTNNGTNYQYLASAMNSTTVNNKTLLVGGNAVVAQANGSTLSTGIVNTNAIKTNNTNLTLSQISNELQTGNGTLVIKPHKLILINNNTVTQQIVSNSSQYSIIIINENSNYIAVAMNKELEDSMFTRLFFMGGAGLTKFKPLYGQPGVMVWGVS